MGCFKFNSIATQDCNHGFRQSRITLSKDCKNYLKSRYDVIFKIINENGVYNPLKCVKNRRADLANNTVDNKYNNNDYSTGLISNNRGKQNIWNVSPLEILDEYEQRNNIVSIPLHRHTFEESNPITQSNYSLSRVGSSPISLVTPIIPTIKNSRRLSHELITPSIQGKEREESSSPANSRIPRDDAKKHSKTLSLNNIADNDEHKSKRWSLHFFKRKDKKPKKSFKKNKRSKETDEVPDVIDDEHLHLSNYQRIDSSSSDHNSRSSAEYARSLSDREPGSLEVIDNEKFKFKCENVGKFEKEELTDDTCSRRDSIDTSPEHSDKESLDSGNFQVLISYIYIYIIYMNLVKAHRWGKSHLW